MKSPLTRPLVWMAVLCCSCMMPVSGLRAQAPPGPLPPSHPLPPPPPAPPAKKKPQVEPRKSLAGFWKLNQEESDDVRTKFEDARKRQAGSGGGNGGGNGGGSGSPRVGVGYPPYPGGGPNGPYGGPGGRMGGNQDSDLSERLQDAVRPAYTQEISLKSTEVDLTDDHNDMLVFFTDGRKIQKSKSKENVVQEISAQWNGAQLVTDEKGPRNTKMSRTFELSPDGRQLFETWHVANGASASPIVIRFVYNAEDQYGR